MNNSYIWLRQVNTWCSHPYNLNKLTCVCVNSRLEIWYVSVKWTNLNRIWLKQIFKMFLPIFAVERWKTSDGATEVLCRCLESTGCVCIPGRLGRLAGCALPKEKKIGVVSFSAEEYFISRRTLIVVTLIRKRTQVVVNVLSCCVTVLEKQVWPKS